MAPGRSCAHSLTAHTFTHLNGAGAKKQREGQFAARDLVYFRAAREVPLSNRKGVAEVNWEIP